MKTLGEWRMENDTYKDGKWKMENGMIMSIEEIMHLNENLHKAKIGVDSGMFNFSK